MCVGHSGSQPKVLAALIFKISIVFHHKLRVSCKRGNPEKTSSRTYETSLGVRDTRRLPAI